MNSFEYYVKNASFTKFPNLILEAILSFKFTSRERAIMLAITRKTFGYGKEFDILSHSQLGELTGIHRQHIGGTIRNLIKCNAITVKGESVMLEFSINREVDKWRKNTRIDEVRIDDLDDNESQRTELERAPGGTELVPLGGPNLVPLGGPNLGRTIDSLLKKSFLKKGKERELSYTTKKTRTRKQDITFSQFLELNKDDPDHGAPKEGDKLFTWTSDAGITTEWVYLAWYAFIDRYEDDDKKYKDWVIVFRKAVKGNWLGLWYTDKETQELRLTSTGMICHTQLLERFAREKREANNADTGSES